MLTTGFKLWFGLCVLMVAAAVFAGYTTGGTETGPISLGWIGGVGNHVVYTLLMLGAASMAVMAIVSQAFRDSEPEAAIELLGVDEVPEAQSEIGNSWWPVFSALGVSILVVGLVVHPAVFVVGIIIIVAIGFEWTMTNWSEKASSDPELNSELRERLMRPIEIPLIGALGIGVIVLAVSRILLASSGSGAVWVATIVGVIIFGTAFYLSKKPSISRGLIQSILFVGIAGILIAGVVSTAIGEREFHHKGPHHHDDKSHMDEKE